MEEQKILENKYSMLKSIVKPFWLVTDNLGMFLTVGTFFSMLMMVLSYLFGHTYLCLFNLSVQDEISCSSDAYSYVPYILLKLLIISMFITVWVDSVFMKKNINEKYGLQNWRGFLRNYAVLCLFIFLNLLPVVSGFLLLVRVPNPQWLIELAYFTVISIGFVVPFILMRFYGVLAKLLNGGTWNGWKQAWDATSGHGIKIIFSVTVMFIFCMLLLISVNGVFQTAGKTMPEVYNMAAELLFNIMTLLICAMFVNYLEVQKEMTQI